MFGLLSNKIFLKPNHHSMVNKQIHDPFHRERNVQVFNGVYYQFHDLLLDDKVLQYNPYNMASFPFYICEYGMVADYIGCT